VRSNLSRSFVVLICFMLVFGTLLEQKVVAANPISGDQSSSIPNEPVTGAAYGNGVYVAVGYYGNILRSMNGLDWQIAADKSRLDVTYTGVAFGSNLFVTVGFEGTIMTSSDGVTWTQQDSTTTNTIARVAYVSVNGINKFYAVSQAGTLLSSPDGVVWTSASVGTSKDLTSIAISNNAIVIGDSSGYVHTSSNGTSWAHTKLADAFFINSVLNLNGRFYANDALAWSYTSTDGFSWSKLGAPFKTSSGSTPNQIFGGLYDGSKYYLFGFDGRSYGGIYTSTDGVIFSQQSIGSTMTAQNAFYANGVYMQLGNDGIVVSTDGVHWKYPYGGEFTSITYDGDKYIAVGKNGNDGFMKVSTNFVDWTPIALPSLVPALKSIVYGNGKYVAVSGSPGFVLTSTNGNNWSVNPTAVTEYGFTSIAYGGSKFVAVTDIGEIYTSTDDGATWKLVKEDTNDYISLWSVSYNNGSFYAVGDSGTFLQSMDGMAWVTVGGAPTAASFDKHFPNQTIIPLALNNNALTSISVSNRGSELIRGTDYNVSGGTVTISKEFLSQLAVGWQTFTYHFNDGASQTLIVKVINSSPQLSQVGNVQISSSGVVSWSGVANAVSYEVQVYRNGSVWGSAISVTAASTNADILAAMRAAGAGNYTVKVTAKGDVIHYLDGPKSAASGVRTIYKTPTEDGTANKAGTSQNANFSIIVNAQSGTTVKAEVLNKNVLVSGVTTVSGKAILPIDLAKLSEGTNDISISLTDVSGNFSESLTVPVTKDTIPPKKPTEDGTANKAGTSQNANFSIIVDAETGAAVTAKVGSTNVLQSGASVTAVGGKATLPIDLTKLSEGNNVISIVVSDAAGNASGTLTVPVTKDTIPPTTPTEDGTADKAGTTHKADFNIVVNAEDGATVTANVGSTNVLHSGASVTTAGGKATLPIDLTKLSEGTNDIVIVVTDAAGNASGVLTVPVTKDTTPPTTPTEDGTANKAGTSQNANFSIIVDAETGAAVTAKVGSTNVLHSGASVTAVGGKATLPIDLTKLSEGANDIVIVVSDAVGNVSGALTVSVTKDTTSPADPVEDGTANKAGTSQNANFNIVVNAEDGATVTAKVGGVNVLHSGASVTAAGGKATLPIDLTKLSEGTNDIVIVVTDVAGNASGVMTVPVTKDTTVPTTPTEDGTANKAGTSQNANFSIIVDAETGAAVTAEVRGVNVLLSGSSITAASGKATLPIDLTKLSEGTNDIVIVVTDAAGNASGRLTITVIRAASSNADLCGLSVNSGAFNETFAATTTLYTQSVANNVESVTVTPTVDAAASVKVNGTNVVSDHASAPIPLSVGENTITVTVKAADNSTKVYTIHITRISNNALLSSLDVDQGTLSPAFLPSEPNYTVNVSHTITSLNFTLTRADPTETISVTGAVYNSVTDNVYSYSASNLNIGSNLIRIMVTAQDGTTNPYYLTVDRAPAASENADLSGLMLSSGELSPSFVSGTTVYTSSVDNVVSSLSVTASVYDRNATMTVNGVSTTSGQVSGAISLNVGTNTINIVVTAQNGTTNTYVVTVNRASRTEPSDDGGSTEPTLGKVISKDGNLTLPAGKPGEVSLGDAVTISIPADAAGKELKLTIEKVLDTQKLLINKEVLVSSIYEILKNFSENFNKPVTLTFAFDPTSLKKNQKAAVFYYDEANKEWVEVFGGKVNGNHITVEVDHFTKYAVFAVDQEVPIIDTKPTIDLKDIAGHWAEANIKQAVSNGIVTGYPNETFKPNHTVTRAEFTVMLMKTLKLQGEGAELSFTDSAKIGAWAQKAVAQAVQAGIIKGYKDGTFRPDAEITRVEMAAMVAMALGQSNDANAATRFADDKYIPSWVKGSVAYLKQAGIVQGKGDNLFAPQDHATRAEAVTVLLKVWEQKSK